MSVAAHHSMDQWGPRRATSLKEARDRTALVHILRLLFTIGAVLSAGVLIGYLANTALRDSTTTSRPPPTAVTAMGPQFRGRDAHDKPYELNADTARRRRENPSLIDLTNPKLEDAASTTVSARNGVWDEKNNILELVGDVVMTDAGGYTFTSEATRMYVEQNRVLGLAPLKGVGQMGVVTADEYEVLDDGNRIVLKGNVTTTITIKKKKRTAGGGNSGGGR